MNMRTELLCRYCLENWMFICRYIGNWTFLSKLNHPHSSQVGGECAGYSWCFKASCWLHGIAAGVTGAVAETVLQVGGQHGQALKTQTGAPNGPPARILRVVACSRAKLDEMSHSVQHRSLVVARRATSSGHLFQHIIYNNHVSPND